MLNIETLHSIMEELAKERPIFHSEADFQHALAWKIREKMIEKGYRTEVRLELSKKIKRRIFNENERKKFLEKYTEFLGENKNDKKKIDECMSCYRNLLLKYAGEFDQYMHIDIWLIIEDAIFAIELKYKHPDKASPEIEVNQESFYLKAHSAEDQGSYDFTLDIERLEHIVSTNIPGYVNGYCILLTNNWRYWRQPNNRKKRSQYNEFFPIDESDRGNEKFLNGGEILQWLGKDRLPLELNYKYECRWRHYSNIPLPTNPSEYDQFKEFRYLLLKIPGQLA